MPTPENVVPLNLNDPVTVEQSDHAKPSLQGIVAYLGTVDFSPESDFVGIRLTGASVGLGRNDGTVKGRRYFDAGKTPNSGLFVRYSSNKIQKRKLSRLHELQLKKELGLVSGNNFGRGAGEDGFTRRSTGSTPKSSTGLKTPSVKSTRGVGANVAAAGSSSANASTKRRLEALRERHTTAAAKSAACSSSRTPPPEKIEPSSALWLGGGSDIDGGATPEFATKPSSSAVSAAKARVRLQELRLRSASSASSAGSIASTVSPKDGTNLAASSFGDEGLKEKVNELSRQLQSQKAESLGRIDRLSEELQIQKEEKSKLQALLEEREQNVVDALKEKEKLKEALDACKMIRAEQVTAAAASKTDGGNGGDLSDDHEKNEGEEETSDENKPGAYTQEYVDQLADVKAQLETRLSETQSQLDNLHAQHESEKENRMYEITQLRNEIFEIRARANAAERELSSASERESSKFQQAAAFLKEKAKMSSEIAALHRRITEFESAALDADTTLEELTLDKEALTEERDQLVEQVDEFRLDVEAAQVEAEELKLELEEVRGQLEEERERQRTAEVGGKTAASPLNSADADAEDVARALSSQNSRLREALLRLREQSNYDKIELSKQLRAAERDAAITKELEAETKTLKESREKLEVEVRELKEIIDTNAAYEKMVEDLSERIGILEEDNLALRNTVSDMEEAADIAAEMEEIQAEESKALLRDVEGRDTIIRNLEEAIKMQRRRETEFQKTVGKYRSMIETLKQEKTALLELREGGEGEKNRLLATSQRALAQAAQLVSDQVASRKREAVAAFDKLQCRASGNLAVRLESLLPREEFVVSEISSIKSEVLLSKVSAKASLALAGASKIFKKTLDSSQSNFSSVNESRVVIPDKIKIADSVSQQVAAAIHQTKFAEIAAKVSADSILLLCLGQWPDLLTPQQCLELGSAVVHPFVEIDVALSHQLRILMEEGVLSPHRTSLSALEESVRNMRSALFDRTGSSEIPLVPLGWAPPGWTLVKDVTAAKYLCLGALAAITSVIRPSDEGCVLDESGMSHEVLFSALIGTKEKMNQIVKESIKVSHRLAIVGLKDDELLRSISHLASAWEKRSGQMLEAVASMLSMDELSTVVIVETEQMVVKTMEALSEMSSRLKAANFLGEDATKCHPLSPEGDEPWERIVTFVNEVKSNEGNGDFLIFQERARSVEEKIAHAIRCESKLSSAMAKVTELERSLSTRTKEVAMQNARMSDLEALLVQSSAQTVQITPKKSPATTTTIDNPPSEELNRLWKENKILSEAVEVLQAQLESYEAEKLKEGGRSSKKSSNGNLKLKADADGGTLLGQDASSHATTSSSAGNARTMALEASFFRPALLEARAEAAAWRAKTISESLADLPSLSIPVPLAKSTVNITSGQPQDGEETDPFDLSKDGRLEKLQSCREELLMASAKARLVKASISVVDLQTCAPSSSRRVLRHNRSITVSRMKLREQRRMEQSSLTRLAEASAAARLLLTQEVGSAHGRYSKDDEGLVSKSSGKLLGKVTLRSGFGPTHSVPLVICRDDLGSLHDSLLQ